MRKGENSVSDTLALPGGSNDHAVIWLGGDIIIESSDSDDPSRSRPRIDSLRHLEDDTFSGYTYERQAYRLKRKY
jgi:hypothetical protein